MSPSTTGRGMNKSEIRKFSSNMGNVFRPSTAPRVKASLRCTTLSSTKARLSMLSFRASARVPNAKLASNLSL